MHSDQSGSHSGQPCTVVPPRQLAGQSRAGLLGGGTGRQDAIKSSGQHMPGVHGASSQEWTMGCWWVAEGQRRRGEKVAVLCAGRPASAFLSAWSLSQVLSFQHRNVFQAAPTSSPHSLTNPMAAEPGWESRGSCDSCAGWLVAPVSWPT